MSEYAPREVRHGSGMVEFIPDPRAEARRILDEHGLSAMVDIFARLRRIEAALCLGGDPSFCRGEAAFSLPAEGVSDSMGSDKHPFEVAVERFLDQQATIQRRLAKGGLP